MGPMNMNAVLLFVLGAGLGLVSGDGHREGGNLRRRRVSFEIPERVDIKRTEFMMTQDESALEEVWNQGLALELDQEKLLALRFLQSGSDDGSMSMRPSPRPTPVPAPTTPTAPTAPTAPTTPGPTQGGGGDSPTGAPTGTPPGAPTVVSAPTTTPVVSPTATPGAPTGSPTTSPTPPAGSPTIAPTAVPTPAEGAPTGTPTADCLAGTTREAFLQTILVQVTDEATLTDPTTAQGQAFDWMVNTDTIDVCASTTLEQRYGLTTLYFSTDGVNWTNQTEWLTSTFECTWEGITCAESGAALNLNLEQNNLSGPLPNEISTLFALETFEVFGNSLTGPIVAGVGNMTSLLLFDIEENFFTGLFFTAEILSLTSLVALRGSTNQFEDIIPGEIGGLTNLRQLWLAENALGGNLPTQIGDLTSLESFIIYNTGDNGIDGTIPTEMGNLVNLTFVQLYNNSFTGTIPVELYNIANIVELRLDQNDLSGPAMNPLISNWVNLQDLRLYDNGLLTGVIPTTIGSLTALEVLAVNDLQLSGTLPTEIGGLAALDFLDVSDNNAMTGAIPTELFDLQLIRLVYLSNNTFTGTFPANYGNPPLLRDLFVENNFLIGTVPEIAAEQLLNLNEFLIWGNVLTGSVPASICALRNDTEPAIGILEDLWSDCGGDPPEIACDFPACCNRCFV